MLLWRYYKDTSDTLGMAGYTRPELGSINLQKTSIFICMQKMNVIIHFFLKILYFKEFCNLIDWQHFDP